MDLPAAVLRAGRALTRLSESRQGLERIDLVRPIQTNLAPERSEAA